MMNKNFRKTSIALVRGFLATATVITAFMSTAIAAPKVEIIGAGYGGSGCSAGTASVVVSPDGQELSVIFDNYSAIANSTRDRRKTCNLTIPIKVPSGYQISLFDADYRGYIAPETSGTLRAEYFFAGERGPVFSRTIRGEENYTVRDKLMAESWSRCGDSLNMRANTSMIAKGKGAASVDSLDLTRRAGIIYHIKYRGCPSN
nr:DUF4360 domain-containing protein [Calothrix elsteri]